ncbi:MAG: glycoside hydrolase family 140 protein [Bacteroidota bacterium]
MRFTCLFIVFFLVPSMVFTQKLSISEDGRRFENSDGSSFLWLGDTAWELFHKLNREEADEYLKNRSEKGFTVIQAVILAELNGLRSPNPYGDLPLINNNPENPNEAYFKHVDYIVNKANELGMVVGILPTWGDKIYSENPGAGPIIFTPENAAVYGEYLGNRYSENEVVWILGGDRNVANDEVFSIWNAMAKGIEMGSGNKQLITYHPRGTGVSSWWFHNEEWLDFNMYQSGHEAFNSVYSYAEDAYLLQPVKPFVDGEPAYEDIAVRFWEYMDFSKQSEDRVPEGVLEEDGTILKKEHFKEGFITPYHVRIHAYWNFLAGAAGYTYGNNAIWQMYKTGGEIAIPALTDWREAMDRPGAEDMKHVRAVLESRPFEKLIPDQSIIFGENRDNNNHIRAAGSSDNSFLMVYLARGQAVDVVMSKIHGNNAVAWWYNPRNGEAKKIGEFKTKGHFKFVPPAKGENNDWLLVIDGAGSNYPPPGRWK